MKRASSLVVGIDVGGERKDLHAVAVRWLAAGGASLLRDLPTRGGVRAGGQGGDSAPPARDAPG